LKAIIFHELGHIKHNDQFSRNILMRLVIALETTLRAMAYEAIKGEGSPNIVIQLFKAITNFCWMVVRAFSRINEFRADLFSAEMGQGVGLIQAFKIMDDSMEALEEAGVFSEERRKAKMPAVDVASMSYAQRLWYWMDSWSNPHTNKENTYAIVRCLEGMLYSALKTAEELFRTHPFMDTRIDAVKQFLADNPAQVTHQDPKLVFMLATQRDQRALAKHPKTRLENAEREFNSGAPALSI
jgi:Zn-dependent protease with chaperone function